MSQTKVSLQGAFTNDTQIAIQNNFNELYTGIAPVNTTAALTLTPALHANRVVTVNSAAGVAITPPSATGAGVKYILQVGTTVTSLNLTFTAQGSDKIQGLCYQAGAAGAITSFLASGAGTTITLNGSTKGGIIGDIIEVTDIGLNIWSVKVFSSITGTAVTPFS